MSSHQFNFFYYLAPAVIRAALGILVMVPLTTNILDPKDFGIVALITIFVSPIYALATSGSSWVLGAHFFSVDRNDRGVLLFNILAIDLALRCFWSAIFLVIAYFALPSLVKEYEPRYFIYFSAILTTAIFSSLWPAISQFLILNRSASIHAGIELLQWFTSAAVTIACLYVFQLGLLALIIAPASAALVSLCCELLAVRKHLVPAFDRRWLREATKLGAPAIPANLTECLAGAADKYFLQKWSSIWGIGIYAHSQNYGSLMKTAGKSLQKVLSPYCLEAYGDGARGDDHELRRVMQTIQLLLLPVGVALGLLAPDFIGLLTHGKFQASAPLVGIWWMQVLTMIALIPYTNYLVKLKRSRTLSLSSVIPNCAALGVIAAGTYFFDIIGAAAGVMLSNTLTHLYRYLSARRLACPTIPLYIHLVSLALTATATAVAYAGGPALIAKIGITALVLAITVAIYLAGLRAQFFIWQLPDAGITSKFILNDQPTIIKNECESHDQT